MKSTPNTGAAGADSHIESTAETGPVTQRRKQPRARATRIVGIAALFGAMAAIALVVPVLFTSPAIADGPETDVDWHSSRGCYSQYRVAHQDSDCLHGWWDNTPPASTGVAGGSTYGAKNFCSEYGDIKAHITVNNYSDQHFHLDHGDKRRGRRWLGDISGISCCMNKSDLCHKQQAEPVNGHILVWSGTGTTTTPRNVSYHGLRYVFCRDNPNNVYCENDPEGDAFDTPTLMCGEGDDRAECDADDCERLFEANNPGTGSACTLDSVSYDDAHCTLDFSCRIVTTNHDVSWTQEDYRVYLRDLRNTVICGSFWDEDHRVVQDDEC